MARLRLGNADRLGRSVGEHPASSQGEMAALLFLIFVIVPALEIWVLIEVGQVIGAWWTVGLLLADALLGAWLVRREGRRTWQALRDAAGTGRLPDRELSDAGLVLVGGTLWSRLASPTRGFVLYCRSPGQRPTPAAGDRPAVRRLTQRTTARSSVRGSSRRGLRGTPTPDNPWKRERRVASMGGAGRILTGQALLRAPGDPGMPPTRRTSRPRRAPLRGPHRAAPTESSGARRGCLLLRLLSVGPLAKAPQPAPQTGGFGLAGRERRCGALDIVRAVCRGARSILRRSLTCRTGASRQPRCLGLPSWLAWCARVKGGDRGVIGRMSNARPACRSRMTPYPWSEFVYRAGTSCRLLIPAHVYQGEQDDPNYGERTSEMIAYRSCR